MNFLYDTVENKMFGIVGYETKAKALEVARNMEFSMGFSKGRLAVVILVKA